MTDLELLQRARDALVYLWDGCLNDKDLIERLDDRLAQPEPEPVAWMLKDADWFATGTRRTRFYTSDIENGIPLYTAPPQRDFKFSTIDEAKQPMPAPAGRPQLTDDESRFADAFTALIKAGYGKEAEIVLKCKREWQGLTDEEREEATGWSVEHIETKLKEKNN